MERGPVLLTGAAGGIGSAIATHFVQRGLRLVGLDRDAAALQQLRERLASQLFVPIVCELSQPEAIRACLEVARRDHGVPEVVVNCAGYGGPFHTADEVSDAEWDYIFAVNVRAPSRIAQVVLPWMKERGRGRIVNVASIQGQLGAKRSSTYSASKHALVGYTRSLAAEWGRHGVSVNAVCPGYVATSMGVQNDKQLEHEARVLARTPTGTIAVPEDIAGLVTWLATDASPYLNGSVIHIDGGISADVGI